MQPVATGLTYDDLVELPDDHQRHELVHGQLFVPPAPKRPHQRVVGDLYLALRAHCDAHGGEVCLSPTDVRFAEDTVLVPDLLVVRADRVGLLHDERFVEVAPDLVVEVSSPSTRSHDLVRKRGVYAEFGVAELWFVDLEARRVEVHTLADAHDEPPRLVGEGGTVVSGALPGLTVEVSALLARVP